LNQERQTIKKLAEELTALTYGEEIPKGLCFSICFPLSILYDLFQIKHKITSGKSPKNDRYIDHFWITLLDNEDTIVDPTIRQFDPAHQQKDLEIENYIGRLDRVYIGHRDQNPVTEKFIQDGLELDDWFEGSYGSWTAPIINDDPYRRTLPKYYEDWTNLMNVKAASLLYYYIIKNASADQFMMNKKCVYYFDPIFCFLKRKCQADQPYLDKLLKTQSKNFAHLLNRALTQVD
jgi:hypothetical protein